MGGSSYTYDSAGNITADGTNTYVWSAAGNLATVNTTGGVYTYNIAHQRSKKVAGGNTTQYVYGANGLLYGEYTNAGALIREYVYLNGEPLAQIDAGTPEVLTYIHTDHLGTPRYGTNTGGTSVWSWASDGFGVGAPSGARTVNLRMPGQYYDSESGLFYNWNRYYNPAIGRYISVDPIGTDGGMNTFLYAEANPLLNIDPEGLEVKMCCRASRIKGMEWVEHCWIRTDQMDAGLGGDPNIVPGTQPESPYTTKTYGRDHADDDAEYCISKPSASEECVNDRLKEDLGKDQGPFSAWNNCQTYANGVIKACSPSIPFTPSPAISY